MTPPFVILPGMLPRNFTDELLGQCGEDVVRPIQWPHVVGRLLYTLSSNPWSIPFSDMENYVLRRYGVGDRMEPNVDVVATGEGAALSVTVALNDDYEGGELYVGDTQIVLFTGDAVLFPGGTMHRVLPVTKGERAVLIQWCQPDKGSPYRDGTEYFGGVHTSQR